MGFPSVTKSFVTLSSTSVEADIVKIEFSNLIFVIISTNGKLGDMVLYEEQALNVPGMPSSMKSSTYESRMLIGCDKDESHLLAKKIATDLKTTKKIIVSSTLTKPISYSDAAEICRVLTTPKNV